MYERWMSSGRRGKGKKDHGREEKRREGGGIRKEVKKGDAGEEKWEGKKSFCSVLTVPRSQSSLVSLSHLHYYSIDRK